MSEHTATHAVPKMLMAGQGLDPLAFDSLYEAMPPGTRAELIDEVVRPQPRSGG